MPRIVTLDTFTEDLAARPLFSVNSSGARREHQRHPVTHFSLRPGGTYIAVSEKNPSTRGHGTLTGHPLPALVSADEIAALLDNPHLRQVIYLTVDDGDLEQRNARADISDANPTCPWCISSGPFTLTMTLTVTAAGKLSHGIPIDDAPCVCETCGYTAAPAAFSDGARRYL